jgi:ABC-type multidrug transport system ATPase subunit
MMSYTLKDTILYVENLSISYGDKLILKDINFSEKDVARENIVTGQTIAFLGRSGRGKSTLFKALTGLIEPNTGQILIRDIEKSTETEVKAKKVKEGDVGFVDQKYTLFRNKTIEQTLHFALRKSKLSKPAKQEKIDKYLTNWGLSKFRNQYPNELSGGQRQRTAIIEQIFCSGTYMILDEPFSGLDVGNIENVKESLKLISNENTLNTVIFSTHDIELAVALADSIYVIGYPTIKGKQESYGTIVGHFDLKEMNLAWQEFNGNHLSLCAQIKKLMLES